MQNETDILRDERFMAEAMEIADRAAARGEVPVGCVIVHGEHIIGRGGNTREESQNPIHHAEIRAIEEASSALGSWRLEDTTLYVTLEPCPMCAGAIVNARIPRVVFGCRDPKAGAVRTLYTLLEDERLNHRCEVVEGVLGTECSAQLSRFFTQLRARKKADPSGSWGKVD